MDRQKVEKVTLSLTTEVIRELDRRAEVSFGNRRGKRSLFVEMLLRHDFQMNTEKEHLRVLENGAEK
ncbi:hypothetical protein MUP59_10115 [Candidatus Bathyarchaeota archaeon]|nr:hypothetical protein [Candidatus Bathyarchaeota archaeon]